MSEHACEYTVSLDDLREAAAFCSKFNACKHTSFSKPKFLVYAAKFYSKNRSEEQQTKIVAAINASLKKSFSIFPSQGPRPDATSHARLIWQKREMERLEEEINEIAPCQCRECRILALLKTNRQEEAVKMLIEDNPAKETAEHYSIEIVLLPERPTPNKKPM